MKYIYLIGIGFLLLLVQNSCRRSNPPRFENSDLVGNWVRLESTKPKYDSMVVNYDTSNIGGFITDVPSGGDFETGQLKWRRILPSSGDNFEFEDRGSDGNYYEGTMTFIPTDTSGNSVLEITIDFGGHQNGERQTWIRY